MFLYISEETATNRPETVLRKRSNVATTIPGTLTAHCFVPVDLAI
jgi:hypothetical protein